jgi:acetyl-CoA synthetase
MQPSDEHAGLASRLKTFADYERLYRASLDDPAAFWNAQSRMITWFSEPHATFDRQGDDSDFEWFPGGRLNAAFNCVDRHAAVRPNKTAIVWAKNEPGEYESITYGRLKREVSRIANVLKAHGVRKGDRVCLYLPMIPELVFTVLACARIGAVHTVVFAGFSAEALRDRVLDAHAKVVVTANEGPRGPKNLQLKHITDAAVDGVSFVRSVLVVRRTAADVPMREGRDAWLDEEMGKQRASCPVEWMDSEDPLFILYTSGSTGKPKGVVHTTGGYLVYVAMTHRYVFDSGPDDVHFCTADIGWITGHSYVIYGPLANGLTTVLFESTPTYPDAGRVWQIVDDQQVTTFYTAPTALRALKREGNLHVTRYSRASLQVLGSCGEPIQPDVWTWYHEVVGDKRCAVVDTWWQTETGGVLITPLPGITPCKPGSATLPFFGVEPVLVDDKGRVVDGKDVRGNLCLARPWPGQARTIWGDHKRYRETYYSQFPSMYFTGDGCRRDADGYYWITGRVDDVLNVSGHRLGTAEIESALQGHDSVSEAAVVGVDHPIKGTGILAYVQLKPGLSGTSSAELIGALKEQVRHVIGPIATPDEIRLVTGLPKTRSGKIMRRVLRKIATGDTDDFGDLSTLAEPGVVKELVALGAYR